MCFSSDGYRVTLSGRRIKWLEIGELFRVGDRSVSQWRKRLRDRLSGDRNLRGGDVLKLFKKTLFLNGSSSSFTIERKNEWSCVGAILALAPGWGKMKD